MIKISNRLYVSIFSFFTLFPLIISQGTIFSLIFIAAVGVHELSHIFFLNLFGAGIKRVAVFPFGIDIHADTSRISYKKELVITLAGSTANLVFAVIGYIFLHKSPSVLLLFFVLCNLFLGIMNLIPMSFFDGGKAVRLILYDRLDINKAYYIHKALDISSALIFLCFSLFVVKGSDFNLSVVCLAIYASVSILAAYIKFPDVSI